MKKSKIFLSRYLLVLLILPVLLIQNALSQPIVGLDNWYNHEVNAKTGKPFHYLWTDTANSGYSRWGEIFTSHGAKITTLGRPNPMVLKNVNVYIIVDPDTTTESPDPNYIADDDISAIKSWVQAGGVLAVLANDAPNCEFTHLNKLMSEFGMTFNHVTLHPVTGNNYEMGACTNLPDHPLFKGVKKIYIKEVSDININGSARAILTEKGKVLIAENKFGKGYVFAIGDPWIYNEYIDHDRLPESFDNRKAAQNLTDLLLWHASFSYAQTNELKESSPQLARISDERLNRIDKVLRQSIDSGWIGGAVGFIARDGMIVYNKAFGVSNVETRAPMRKDNIFRIASQTKAITSVAAMMLFEEGKFLLDDPISKYIPEFAHPTVLDKFNEKDSTYTTVAANREVTIRDLLTHTSGIDYAGIGSEKMKAIYAKAGIPTGFVSEKIVLGDKIRRLGKLPLVHQPGEKFTYGLNIDVLGYLVEVLSGESLDHYFHSHIFEPLGMNDTYFYLPASKFDRLVKVAAEDKSHHLVNATGFVDYPLAAGTYYSGGAGLSSTIRDYAVFLQMMLNKGEYNGKRLLARRTVELMTCNQIGTLNVGFDKFGLGFEITTELGQSKLGMSEGSFAWGGYFATTYWADPKEHLVCLLFMQQSPLRHSEIQDKFKALVYQALND